MKKFCAIFALMITMIGCQTEKTRTVEGDLYFKLIDMERFFEAPDSLLTKLETGLHTTNPDTLTAAGKGYYKLLKFMSDRQILRKPFIRLRQDNGVIIMVSLDHSDYQKLRDYRYSDLVKEHKRVRIKAEVLELEHDSLQIYENIKIISINEVNGKTYWKK